MIFLTGVILCLLSLASIARSAAEEVPKLVLLDCFDRKAIALPGPSTHFTWIAHNKVLTISAMDDELKEFLTSKKCISPDTTKMMRCCVGYVEGPNADFVDQAQKAIAQDMLHPQNKVWAHPFDFRGRLNLKEFISGANIDAQLEETQAFLRWFRCTDDVTAPFQNHSELGICPFVPVTPSNSLLDSMQKMVMSLDEQSNDGTMQKLKLMMQSGTITPEVLALTDAYVRNQGDFHEGSYLILNPEKFAAFLTQEFSE